ncbi:arylesterase [Hyphomicrobium methylovorum]|uniref:arylesterase n=1 Tax=Hyphomicrobium methylovorum TaxID=84 RepID=UPI0015E688FE|nr:arylesterase [Hyphomicrobium methylovorum]MBA2126117.1 arylesterase [Hyphomicrobium methylovorum]
MNVLEPIRMLALAIVLSLLSSPLSAVDAADVPTTPVTILAFGDSLTAGYGVKATEAFPAQLQMALEAKGYKVTVLNGGVSGDTTSGGAQRLDWALEPPPDGVILELGANDALRGIDPKEPRANLDAMLEKLKAKNIAVLIAGMRAPNNWGADYSKAFDAIYPDLAAKYGYPLYPFFLDGVALDRSFSQSDGLHPTAAGIAEIVKRILPEVETLVQTIAQRKTSVK